MCKMLSRYRLGLTGARLPGSNWATGSPPKPVYKDFQGDANSLFSSLQLPKLIHTPPFFMSISEPIDFPVAMYHYRVQELPQADTMGYPTSTGHVRIHPRPATPACRTQYLVSPSRPPRPATPPMWNGEAIQTLEATYPVFSDDVDLATDFNTIANRDIRPPAWATVDDHYYERRGVPPARRFAIPSSDAMWGRQSTLSRSPSSITIAGAPESSRGHDYYSSYRYQIPNQLISEFSDDSEDDEMREPANMVAPNLSSAMEVQPYHQERHLRPWSSRQAPATAAASGPSRPLKGIKRVLHKIFNKFRRKRPPGRLPSPMTYLPTAPVPVATMGAFTVISAPWTAYDGVQYCVHDELNTGASLLERTHTFQMHVGQRQPHPLTMATDQADARVQIAMQTGGSEVDLLMMGTSRTRQRHDWEDGVIVDLMR